MSHRPKPDTIIWQRRAARKKREKMKVAIEISKTTAALAGRNQHGRCIVEVDMATLTPEQRATLVAEGSRHDRDLAGADYVLPSTVARREYPYKLITDLQPVEPTVAQVCQMLDQIAVARTTEAKEQAEKLAAAKVEQAAVAERRAEALREKKTRHVETKQIFGKKQNKEGYTTAHNWSVIGADIPWHDLDTDQEKQTFFALPEYRSWQTEIKVENSRREQAAKDDVARQDAEILRKIAEKEQVTLDWIAAHGSTRLQRLVKEEIEYTAVYRAERLAADRPGWKWADKVQGESSEPRNATTAAFELLDEARLVDEDAELVYWTVDCPEDDEPCHDEDGEETKFFWRGYAVTAEFLGKTIVYGIPEKVLNM